ncbi:forespore capture DNA-binding protein RefZ [Salipaludibacillus sp. CUR1]|uniref:forespore capture DNA-binding protein RefZ n=1 Tax=Salipaludibacillus sp. CUR1 TaxID=2820003 RepID=UPI001E4BFFDE|nr:forespore capture DNA-binding protein RefZ [Salipaludibacillus sp. CUR1]MCE7793330.1 forespore capture DNA-binding protein RefZ [Salipaludibacillus sp. CUR1]
MNKKASKEKVMQAAIEMFNMKGFTGSSVRDIANRAGANVALISYYFGSKQGLLEHLMTGFLEGYVSAIEVQCEKLACENGEELVFDRLLKAIWNVMVYQQNNHELARFIHREITLDTTLVRELMASYLAKEKHLYHTLLNAAYEKGEMATRPNEYFVLQLRGMLTMPFLHPQYIREVYHLMPHENHFLDQYFSELCQWVATHFKECVIAVPAPEN